MPSDPNGDALSVTTFQTGVVPSALPPFVTCTQTSSSLTYTVTSNAPLGSYSITILASDTLLSQTGVFNLQVVNTAPTFATVVRDQVYLYDRERKYKLPEVKDDEENTVTVTA